ncbi:MAG: hypothetical protein ABW185_29715 [Sedimenticola sp.]
MQSGALAAMILFGSGRLPYCCRLKNRLIDWFSLPWQPQLAAGKQPIMNPAAVGRKKRNC